jgi:hypothetical protein
MKTRLPTVGIAIATIAKVVLFLTPFLLRTQAAIAGECYQSYEGQDSEEDCLAITCKDGYRPMWIHESQTNYSCYCCPYI